MSSDAKNSPYWERCGHGTPIGARHQFIGQWQLINAVLDVWQVVETLFLLGTKCAYPAVVEEAHAGRSDAKSSLGGVERLIVRCRGLSDASGSYHQIGVDAVLL